MSIRVSEKHGVNPSLLNCFVCGESKGIALLGKLKGDVQAPPAVILDYEPCDKCKEKQKEYVLAIEVISYQPEDKRPPIQKDFYPTGRTIWIKDHILEDLIGDTEMRDDIIEQRAMLCDTETMSMFIDIFEKVERGETVAIPKKGTDSENESDSEPASIIYSQKTIVARKEWICSKCGKTIRKGDSHIIKKVRANGKLEAVRECMACKEGK